MADMSPQQRAAALRAQNMASRNWITQNCPEFTQQIFAGQISSGGAAGGNVVNILPKNVGLIKGFKVRVDVDIVVPAGVTLARTPFGAWNVLSKIEFVDLANLTRISTGGWHLGMMNAARFRRAPGSAVMTDTPTGFGNNYGGVNTGMNVPAAIAAATTQRISIVYDVPLAYSNDDLRGAIYAGVVNATMQLNLTINPSMVSSAADTVLSVYQQTGAGVVQVQNAKVTVYQQFLDQLPIGVNGPALPFDDLSTAYQLKNTSLVGMAVGQDFPVPFANFSDFLSTSIVMDNGGTLSPGTDINYFAMLTANASQVFRIEPWLQNYNTRNMLDLDVPLGMYYFDHRRRPVNTVQYGNQQLVINPNTVNTGAQALVGWEMMTKQGTVNASGSLPAG